MTRVQRTQIEHLIEAYDDFKEAWENLGNINCDELDCDQCPLNNLKLIPCRVYQKKLY